VTTWTLCSIPEVGRAGGEVYRVLRPLGDRCRLNLGVPALVGSPPFAEIRVDRFEVERMPRAHGMMDRGAATKWADRGNVRWPPAPRSGATGPHTVIHRPGHGEAV
jgi:hypothetical protein